MNNKFYYCLIVIGTLFVAGLEIGLGPWLLESAFGGDFLLERMYAALFALFLMFIALLLEAITLISKSGGLLLFAKKIWRCGSYLLLVLMLSFILVLVVDGLQNSVTQSRGDRILMALDDYKADVGNCPEYLGLLEPKYIDEVPKTFIGIMHEEFSYRALDEGSCSLVYVDLGGLLIGNKTSTKSWFVVISGVGGIY